MLQSVYEKRYLPVVQGFLKRWRAAQQPLHLSDFLCFPGQVLVQRLDCLFDDTKLVDDEIRGVIVVGLRVEVRTTILSGRLLQDTRDGQLFGQPTPLTNQRPVEQGTRGSSVSVGEGVGIGQLEMQKGGSQHRVQERFVVLSLICKLT